MTKRIILPRAVACWRGCLLCLLLIIPLWANAACTFFVATDGSDTNPGTSASPFRTIQAGANAAVTPGDTVCIRPGVYFENTQVGSIKGVVIANSGTPGNPITFQPDPALVGTVVIDMQNDVSKATPVDLTPTEAVGFFVGNQDFITIRGLEIRNVTTGILTRAFINPPAFDPPSNIVIERNHIHDVIKDQRNPNFDSNIAAVEVTDCFDCVVRGNRLHDISQIELDGSENFQVQNNAGVFSFGMLRTVVENNEIFNAHTGVFQKSWTQQPVVPADFGVKVRRNLIHDVIWGVHLSLSGGSGRTLLPGGVADANRGHHNAEISENIFFSTAAAEARFGPDYKRMEWALQADLRGASDQSTGLKFFNNTVIAHNGINVDAITGIEVFNNFFSLSAQTPGTISGPHIAVQTRYTLFKAEAHLDAGTVLNAGTVAAPIAVTPSQGEGNAAAAGTNRAAGVCIDNTTTPDPNLVANGGNYPVSTAPNLAPPGLAAPIPGDTQYFCDDNVQFESTISLADFNYYHIPGGADDSRTFRIERFGGGVEQLLGLGAWQALQAFDGNTGAGDYGMAVSNPDQNSPAVDLTPNANILKGVTITPNGPVTIDPAELTPFVHTAALAGKGRVGGLAAGAPVAIGAFPNGPFDPAGGPFDPATDSGFVGNPRFTEPPAGLSVGP